MTSIGNFLREMNKAFHQEDEAYFKLPDSRAMAAQYLLLYDGDEIDNFHRQRAKLGADFSPNYRT